jgi:TonB family protein
MNREHAAPSRAACAPGFYLAKEDRVMSKRRVAVRATVLGALMTAFLFAPWFLGTSRAADEPTAPKPLASCMTQPSYPEQELKAGVEGTVYLNVEILASGKIGKITSKQEVERHPAFTASATAAIAKWCFEPAMLNGKPVDISVVIPVRFKLDKK